MSKRKVKERKKAKDLFSLGNFLSRKEHPDNCFLLVDGDLVYAIVARFDLGIWITLTDIKGYLNLDRDGFYEANLSPFKVEFDSKIEKSEFYLFWTKMTDEVKIKDTQKVFDSMKVFFRNSESIAYSSFDLEFELREDNIVVNLHNIKESLFLVDQSIIRSCIPCYFGEEEYYLDRDVFLFLRGLDFASSANCWISENPEIPIKFTEYNDKNSKTIAMIWSTRV